MKKQVLTFWGVMALFCLLLVACGTDADTKKESGSDSADEAKKAKWVVATDAAYPPFEKQEGSGDITGFDVDVIKAIAEVNDAEVEMKHTGWDPLFEAIKNGSADVAISAITITDERKELYDFSDPYFDAKQFILVPEGSNISSFKDLKDKKIGVQAGTTGEEAVKEEYGTTYSGLKSYDDTPAAMDDLVNGRVDAVVADNAVVLEYIKTLSEDKFKKIEDPHFAPEQYGIMVKKGNGETLEQVNEGLKKIKENGTYDEIFAKYFGESK
ncbi:basic amino acid ABC transporter substrate-binding protein [Mechercharimyces sp. CAU 1602]|uniref:basic amino acid ABC transporter substrate-binding protein n=1 Tax=Mechercharimyces sp. CAU 1602 TaxID=2973933 RepID=UPI0021612F6F|nr:basic amino acid ABC transporter substrate-binding protein [Mechercharimyces sp. CAU 1602]MCS1352234.1 basic amino acid ABC transporter substrate-binding protein [Mechercharimyces sp. CAU 1602]